MRVISGIYRRRRFEVPKTFKARPTTDFAKENLFNVLTANYLSFEEEKPVALDLFAGTGSITIELISRGCSEVLSVEKDRSHYLFIKEVLKKLGTDVCKPIRGDVFKFISSCKMKFDFIFADPPYALKELEEVPRLILERDLLRNEGMFVMEHPKTFDFSGLPHFYQHREYGSVNFSIFLKEAEKTDA